MDFERHSRLAAIRTNARDATSPDKATSPYRNRSNPLFLNGDILGSSSRREDSAGTQPALVAQVQETAARKTDTVADTQAWPSSSTAFMSPNPFFPSPARRDYVGRAAPARSGSAITQNSGALALSGGLGKDDDSVDSVVLDDGPNPVKPATPGGAGPRTFMSAISRRDGPESPVAALTSKLPVSRPLADALSSELQRIGGKGNGDAAAEGTVVPHASISTPEPPVPPGSLGAGTPMHDADMLRLLDSDVPRFVGRPGPLLKPIQCYIVREKGATGILRKSGHVYRLYYEATDSFLLSACKRANPKRSSYIVSLHESVVSRTALSYYGKINSNFIGTEFVVYNKGERSLRKAQQMASLGGGGTGGPLQSSAEAAQLSVSPAGSTADSNGGGGGGSDGGGEGEGESEDGDEAVAAGRSELAVVQYHLNVMGTKGPRKMTIGIPYVDFDTNRPVVWLGKRPQDGMLASLKSPHDERMIKLVNKAPKWNANLGAYCLNFNGRVTQASVKNFQLISDGDAQDRDVLQFGRVGENKFTMDFCWPLTAFQAFCICITSLDGKLACE